MSSDAAKTEGSKAGGKKLNVGQLLVPIIAAVNLIGVGGGAFLAYKGTIGYQPQTLREPAAIDELKNERKKDGQAIVENVMYTMPPFTVNLAGTPSRMIRVEMTFAMLDKDGFEEIVRNSPVARDEIVRILNGKSFDDVETIQGKLFLKDQIAVSLNQSLKSGVVKDIYFNEFLVQ